MSQIPLSILETIKLFISKDCCLALKTNVMVANLLFYGNYFISIFLVEDSFQFWKDYAWWPMYIFVVRVTARYLWGFYINTRSFNLVWCEHKRFVWPFRPLGGIHSLANFTIFICVRELCAWYAITNWSLLETHRS